MIEGLQFTPIFDLLILKFNSIYPALVFGKIYRYERLRSGYCYASYLQLSKELAISKKTIQRSIGMLLNEKFIIDVSPEKFNKKGTARRYITNPEKISELLTEDCESTVVVKDSLFNNEYMGSVDFQSTVEEDDISLEEKEDISVDSESTYNNINECINIVSYVDSQSTPPPKQEEKSFLEIKKEFLKKKFLKLYEDEEFLNPAVEEFFDATVSCYSSDNAESILKKFHHNFSRQCDAIPAKIPLFKKMMVDPFWKPE